jgi:acetyltransferase-like isoleucine patch superfamily enzyme
MIREESQLPAELATQPSGEPGLRRCRLSPALCALWAHRPLRRYCLRLAMRLEGGQYFTGTVRDVLARYHGVIVGAYSYGGCLIPGCLPPGVRVGRYASVAHDVRVAVRNHPTDCLSQHPFFFNRTAGFVKEDTVPYQKLVIEHDAWVAAGTVITPGCRRIGLGAVVGGGAVVTRDVPDFAIVVGNPARIVRYRFDEVTQAAIRDSRWWERTIEECLQFLPEMTRPLGPEPWRHPLLVRGARNSADGGAPETPVSGGTAPRSAP